MGNDIEIRVRVANQTAAGLTAVNNSMRNLRQNANQAGQALTTLSAKAQVASTSLNRLKNEAQDASRAMRGLAVNAAAARAALGDLRAHTTSASNSLRTLQNRAGAADGRLGDLGTRTRAVRGDMDDLDGAVRRLAGNIGGLRGRIGTVSMSAARGGAALGRLRTGALLLAPALLPIGASAVLMAAKVGAATAAVAAFGVAIAPQIIRMSEATQAQGKYADAVRKSGAGSEEAATAQAEMQAVLSKMSPATREATAGFAALREATNKWSNSLSSSTMPVFTKAFATLRGMLPGFTPLVQGAATQLERFVTIAAGGVGSGAFGEMMKQFSGFATGALRSVINGMVHFARTFDGFSGGAFAEFLAYAKENAPLVGESLRNLGDATAHILASMGDLGVSTLALVNALAQLVNAIPTEFLSVMLQAYAAFKLFGLAAAGVVALGGALRGATRSLVAFRAAAVTAGGGLAGLRAAFLGLSAAAKTTVVVAGLTVLVVALSKLSRIGQEAPPNIDKLTTSLGELGRTGKVSGEASRVFGKNLDDLVAAFGRLTDNGLLKFGDEALTLFGLLGDSFNDINMEKVNAFDQGLANLVKNGNPDLAAAALKRLRQEAKGNPEALKRIKDGLGDYKSALKDAAFEQQLVADSMGIFGQAALATSAKLDEQKRAADGLRQALLNLNDVNRSAFDAETEFEQKIDDLAASFKKYGNTLDVTTEAGRKNRDAMSQAAAAQDEMVAAGVAAGESLESMTGKSGKLRSEMMRLAMATFKNKEKATEYVNTLLGAPGEIKTLVKLERKEAVDGLQDVRRKIKETPGAKSVTVKTLNAAAIAALNAVGIKTKRLKDGRTKVYTENGSALGAIGAVNTALNNLDGKTAYTFTFHKVTTSHFDVYKTYSSAAMTRAAHGGATGGLWSGGGFKHRGRGYADGGMVTGPGTGTSDDIFAPWVSNGEFVVNAAATKKHLALLRAINEGRLKDVGFARGGRVSKSEREARRGAAGDLTISHFGRKAGFSTTEFEAALGSPSDIKALVSAMNQWRGIIKKASHGDTERRLLRALDSAGKGLIKHEKSLAKVNSALEKAKDKLDGLKQAAAQMRDSVASGIRGAGNITGLAGENGRVTVGGILGHLGATKDQAQAFAGALGTLKKRGLNKGILADIANAGLEGGGLKTAEALMGASKSDIGLMNKLQGQIASSAKKAGTVTADAMYGAGLKAAEGLVKGLEKRKHSLEKVMEHAASALEKAIRKALHISSKRASGGIVGAAGGGARSGLTLVGEQGPELVRVPYGSRVYSNPDSRRMAAGWGGGSQRPIELVINLDGRTVARQIFDPLRGEVRDRGGLASLGR